MDIKKVRLFYNDNAKSKETFALLTEKLEGSGFKITDKDDYDLAIAIGGRRFIFKNG